MWNYKKHLLGSITLVIFICFTAQCMNNNSVNNPTLAKRDMPELLDAVRNNNTYKVNDLLEKGANPNYKNSEGSTPLALASLYDHLEVVKLLVKYGADINDQTNHAIYNSYNRPALMLSLQEGHSNVAIFLIKHNADVNAQDASQTTPLMQASIWGYLEIVEALLEHGARVNDKNKNGMTALIYAAHLGRAEIVKLLLKHGANPDDLNFKK